MFLLTAAIIAVAATAPDAEVEKKLPLIQEEAQIEEQSDEIALNELAVSEDLETSEEE